MDIIREDVIQITWDIDNDPLQEIAETFNEIKEDAADCFNATSDGMEDIVDEAKKAAKEVEGLGDEFKGLGEETKKLPNNNPFKGWKSFISDIHSKLDNLTNKGIKGLYTEAKKVAGLSFKTIVAGVTALGIAAGGALGGIYKLSEMTSDLGEAQNVVSAVYEQQKGYEYLGDEVNAWAKTLVASHGIAAKSATDYVGQLASMTTGMGVNAEAATEMSKNMVKMVGDWASFYNLDHEEAFTKIKAGLSGESEPLKSLGIIMTESSLSAYALSEGITKAYKDMTEAEKATLRYNFMMSKTEAATGDFANTLNNSLANQMRYFKTLISEIATNMGSNFTGPVMEVMSLLNDFGSRVNSIFADGWQAGDLEELKNIFAEFVNTASDYIAKALPTIISGVSTIFQGITDAFVTALPNILPTLTRGVLEIIGGIKDTIIQNAPMLISAAVEIAAEVMRAIYEVFTGEEMSMEAFEEIKNALKDIMSLVGEVGSFVAKNFGTIAKITLTVVAVTKTYTVAIKALTAAKKIYTAVEKIQEKLTDKSIKNLVKEGAATIAQTAATTAQAAATGAATIAQTALNAAMNLCPVFLLITGIAALGVGLVAFVKYLGSASEKTEKYNAISIENAKNILDFKSALDSCQPSLVDFNNLLSPEGNTISDIDNDIEETESAITEIIKTAIQNNQTLREQDLENIRNYQNELRSLNDEKLAIYQGQQESLLNKIELSAANGGMNSANAVQFVADANNIFNETANAIAANQSNADATALNIYNASAKTAEDMAIYNAAIEQNAATATEQYQAALNTKNETLTAIANASYDIANQGSIFARLSTAGWNVANNNDPNGNFGAAYAENLSKVTGEVSDAGAALIGTVSEIKASGGQLTTEMEAQISAMLTAFDNVPAESEEAAKEVILGLIGGLKSEIPALADTSEMSAKEINDAIRNYLGINSPSTVMIENGKNTAEGMTQGIKSKIGSMRSSGTDLIKGLIQGMESQKSAAISAAAQIANAINLEFDNIEEISSPSKVWQEKGKYLLQGLTIGMLGEKDNAKNTSNSVASVVMPYGENYTPENSTIYPQSSNVSTVNFSPSTNITINGSGEQSERELASRFTQLMNDYWDMLVSKFERNNAPQREA